uniref:Uncharacterized protein n=1 Tax=Oryza nivara TaxID=4536 RepID=A0A0E0HMX2_ORYNI
MLCEVGRDGVVVVAGRAVSAQFATAGADPSSGAATTATATMDASAGGGGTPCRRPAPTG